MAATATRLKVGEEVVHVRSGRRGVVKDPDWHGKGSVRVQFPERQTILAPKTLRRVSDMSEVEQERERQRAVALRKSGVPYDKIERGLRAASEMFPDADELKPVWYNGKVLVEVWKDGRADVLPYDGE